MTIDDELDYVVAVRGYIVVSHWQSRSRIKLANDLLYDIGWKNGPAALVRAVFREVIDALHPGGLIGNSLNMGWLEAFDSSFAARHSSWLKMYPNLTLALVQAARGFDDMASRLPVDFLAAERMMRIEHAVDQLSLTDQPFDEALEPWIEKGKERLRQWAEVNPEVYAFPLPGPR